MNYLLVADQPHVGLLLHVDHELLGVWNQVFGHASQIFNLDGSSHLFFLQIIDMQIRDHNVPFLREVITAPFFHFYTKQQFLLT